MSRQFFSDRGNPLHGHIAHLVPIAANTLDAEDLSVKIATTKQQRANLSRALRRSQACTITFVAVLYAHVRTLIRAPSPFTDVPAATPVQAGTFEFAAVAESEGCVRCISQLVATHQSGIPAGGRVSILDKRSWHLAILRQSEVKLRCPLAARGVCVDEWQV